MAVTATARVPGFSGVLIWPRCLTYSSEYRAELEDDEVVSTIEIEAHSETWEQNQITKIWHIVAEEEQLTLELESEC